MAILRSTLLLAVLVSPLLAGSAAAEIYRCVGADGGELFTANRADCKGPAQEVKGQIQRAPAVSGTASARSAPAPARAAGDDTTQALVWRQKKHQAEQKLRRLRADASTIEEAIAFCQKGGQLRLKDEETGLNEVVPCETVQREGARALRERDELEAYLHGGGLEEECRRAGCLPGWIR